nr:hypothetical protein Iba_chr02eCG9470 [Ipomoea batatas]GMC68363.1 hypothetical protein Iba_chr02fCG11140 [Ipomoea batatas]
MQREHSGKGHTIARSRLLGSNNASPNISLQHISKPYPYEPYHSLQQIQPQIFLHNICLSSPLPLI